MDVAGELINGTELADALRRFEDAYGNLLDCAKDTGSAGFGSWTAEEVVAGLTRYETVRNKMSLVDHELILALDRTDVASRLLTRNTVNTLTTVLKLSHGEARHRAREAEQVHPRLSVLGEPLAPQRPALAAAIDRGSVTVTQSSVILDCTRTLAGNPRVADDQVDFAEQALVEAAEHLCPEDLRKVATKIIDVLDPDGDYDDELQQKQRCLDLTLKHDMYEIKGKLTKEVGAKLWACLEDLAAPRPDDACGPDDRTASQRRHDALGEFCTRALAHDAVTGMGGATATVIITVAETDLRNRAGFAETADGALLSIAELLRLADQAEIMPAFVNDAGAVLSLGRTRRYASRNQTLALIARDRGCSFPDCHHPPQWCDRHHIIAWSDGGTTDLDNLTLLCQYHHYRAFQQGWTCRLNRDGIIECTPPRYLDREQRPIAHKRHFGLVQPTQRDRARGQPALV